MTNCLNPSEEYFYLTEEKAIHRLKIHDGDDSNDLNATQVYSLETVPLNSTIVSSDRTKIGEIIGKGFTNSFNNLNNCIGF